MEGQGAASRPVVAVPWARVVGVVVQLLVEELEGRVEGQEG